MNRRVYPAAMPAYVIATGLLGSAAGLWAASWFRAGRLVIWVTVTAVIAVAGGCAADPAVIAVARIASRGPSGRVNR